ncbi:hypothetical protein VTN77DRAFT_2121 [Rasamsonia byssochlamydoides]|uniref:uncharacterized protein n=1 Tax=Rasamsonia byssochlamydoides TaxID=89139 RepID=UPI00374266EF
MSPQSEPIVSHGRGGQGNIGADPTKYVDGEIVRKGPVGDQGDGAYSAGRGGAGNIGSPHIRPTSPGKVHDTEVVPDISIRPSDGDYHTGRGGQGNVHLDPERHRKGKEREKEKEEKDKEKTPRRDSTSSLEGFAEKVKHKILGK